MKRANRVVVNRTEDGNWRADFYKTHKIVGTCNSKGTTWVSTGLTQTADRESFRAWAIENADKYGVRWQPELQQQAWDRKYDKYENNAQVERDASELMWWTVSTLAEKCKYKAVLKQITLDSIIPMYKTPTGKPTLYCTDGKYDKNGNWAWADLQMDVQITINDTPINIIYPMQIVSGQIKKIKLTKTDIDQMIKDAGYEEQTA